MPTLNYDYIIGGDPVWFRTSGEYAMEAAVTVLKRLVSDFGCVVDGKGWDKAPFYGSLIEDGVVVHMDSLTFTVMCSYDDIFIKRISGNREKFHALCEEIARIEI